VGKSIYFKVPIAIFLIAIFGVITIYASLFVNERVLFYYSVQRRGEVAVAYARGLALSKEEIDSSSEVSWSSHGYVDRVQFWISSEPFQPTVTLLWDPITREHTFISYEWEPSK